jgi:hypothetical protein
LFGSHVGWALYAGISVVSAVSMKPAFAGEVSQALCAIRIGRHELR